MQTWKKKKSHSGYTVKHLRYNYPSTYQLMHMETEVVKKKSYKINCASSKYFSNVFTQCCEKK